MSGARGSGLWPSSRPISRSSRREQDLHRGRRDRLDGGRIDRERKAPVLARGEPLAGQRLLPVAEALYVRLVVVAYGEGDLREPLLRDPAPSPVHGRRLGVRYPDPCGRHVLGCGLGRAVRQPLLQQSARWTAPELEEMNGLGMDRAFCAVRKSDLILAEPGADLPPFDDLDRLAVLEPGQLRGFYPISGPDQLVGVGLRPLGGWLECVRVHRVEDPRLPADPSLRRQRVSVDRLAPFIRPGSVGECACKRENACECGKYKTGHLNSLDRNEPIMPMQP
ncbi:Hypothetical protein MexAM1_META2p0623 (plasmid) [Methylorubrum extorquens AM1]|uniref:Uncharacterized protein n=1 Tax=Methylorubrum extorquens (strain ATCC 14718 / DSM 1338 / JCM 2805 / NCIMB 9133 / AM1) TaxID=272630 RepID=C5B4T8_METEA|nr:Hypothetical protein MexAM1_META2p0623 [Methylorubrum extorquens AM1]